MILYTGFATIVNDRRAFYVPFLFWGTIFVNRIYEKECSLMKKEGYEK